jgi:hypothetical protein
MPSHSCRVKVLLCGPAQLPGGAPALTMSQPARRIISKGGGNWCGGGKVGWGHGGFIRLEHSGFAYSV